MIYNNVDGIGWTFQVVSPNLKSFKDSKQFLIICVVIQLCYGESVEVKGNWMNFIFFVNNEKNCNENIVQSISFYNKLSIRNLINENESGGKYLLERVESIMTREVKLSKDVLLGKICQ